MPQWLRRALAGGLLTPLVKKPPEIPDDSPDARPTNAPDSDISAWIKTTQQSVNGPIRKKVTPQQLGVAVSGGCQIKVIDAALKIEAAKQSGTSYGHVALDVKNAHNAYNRKRCQQDLDAAAATDTALSPLARAHHALCGQPNPI